MTDNEKINSKAGGSNVPRLPYNGLYLNSNQLQDAEPTAFENSLADAIEMAYAAGIHELPELVRFINERGVHDAEERSWTEDSFRKTLSDLAA